VLSRTTGGVRCGSVAVAAAAAAAAEKPILANGRAQNGQGRASKPSSPPPRRPPVKLVDKSQQVDVEEGRERRRSRGGQVHQHHVHRCRRHKRRPSSPPQQARPERRFPSPLEPESDDEEADNDDDNDEGLRKFRHSRSAPDFGETPEPPQRGMARQPYYPPADPASWFYTLDGRRTRTAAPVLTPRPHCGHRRCYNCGFSYPSSLTSLEAAIPHSPPPQFYRHPYYETPLAVGSYYPFFLPHNYPSHHPHPFPRAPPPPVPPRQQPQQQVTHVQVVNPAGAYFSRC